MPFDDERKAADPTSSLDETLARIAQTLGCPVEAFTHEAYDATNTRGLSELLTIWVEMEDDRDRDRLLEFARTLVRP